MHEIYKDEFVMSFIKKRERNKTHGITLEFAKRPTPLKFKEKKELSILLLEGILFWGNQMVENIGCFHLLNTERLIEFDFTILQFFRQWWWSLLDSDISRWSHQVESG
jgi:hypothetical protein